MPKQKKWTSKTNILFWVSNTPSGAEFVVPEATAGKPLNSTDEIETIPGNRLNFKW